jgi:hypothetical protein
MRRTGGLDRIMRTGRGDRTCLPACDSDPHAISIRGHGRSVAQPPTAQRFWVAHATSSHPARIDWKIKDGHYTIVIMNANGRSDFATTTSIGLTLPNMSRYAFGALIAGLLIAGAGIALLIQAIGQRRATPTRLAGYRLRQPPLPRSTEGRPEVIAGPTFCPRSVRTRPG